MPSKPPIANSISGYAGALSVVMFVILMVFATLYIKFTRVSKE